MFSTATELFLNTYFLFEALAGKIVGNGARLFDRLYAAFLLPEEHRAELYALTQRDEVTDIATYADYAQFCRIQKYAVMIDGDRISGDVREIVAVKGGALRKAKAVGLDEYGEFTEAATCKLISESANMGLIQSLLLMGIMQCEGSFVARNEALGKKNLEKAAQWNSIEGILLALYYGGDVQTNIDRLHTVVTGTLYEEIADTAMRAYGAERARHVPECKLLQKAFGMGILKPDFFTPQHSRFIFSEVLELKDKERTLFSGHKEEIAATADLPLKLKAGELIFDSSAVGALPLVRDVERDRISMCALNSDLRGDGAFRPMCISGDSEYLLGLYADAIASAFPNAHVEKLDIADLGDYDFEPTLNNVFVRSCDEDRQNVYILVCKGELRERAADAVKNFLRSDKRKKFCLQHPGVVIDLSSILPVCVCDRQNARTFQKLCDTVAVATVGAAEKALLLEHICNAKASRYRMDGIALDACAEKTLAEQSIDRAESIIDRVIRSNRGARALTITEDMLKSAACGEIGAGTKYGFGGADNENKQ